MQSYNGDKVRLINVFVEHSIDVIFTICQLLVKKSVHVVEECIYDRFYNAAVCNIYTSWCFKKIASSFILMKPQ